MQAPMDAGTDPRGRLGWLRNSAPARAITRWRAEHQPLPTWTSPAPQREAVDPHRGIAFVFQGGGSLTAPQVGMLRALVEAGVHPDLVVGTSAGALNAVAFATDPTLAGLDRLERTWMLLRRRHVAPWSPRALFGAIFGHSDSLLSDTALRHLLSSGLVPPLLEQTAVPAHVVATDVDSGDPVVLSVGDSVTALLASCAIPLFYPPVTIDGRRLIDGGVVADIPVLQAETLGARVSYVFGSAEVPASAAKQLRGPFTLALQALDHVLVSATRHDLAAARQRVVRLPTVTTRVTNPMDFRDTPGLIERGYRQTVEWLNAGVPESSVVPELSPVGTP